VVDLPFLGFLLQSGQENILVDTGIAEDFIVDGQAWGCPTEGGNPFVERALAKWNLTPDDISTVIYTHLHFDHAGNCGLFSRARHIAQKDEWREILDPPPIARFRGDYDRRVIPELERFYLYLINGDMQLTEGIRLLKTPGHTSGSQAIAVSTTGGEYYITGDTFNFKHNAFPHLAEMTGMDGKTMKITPAPEGFGPAIPSSLIHDFYAWYDSVAMLKAMAKTPEFLIFAHEPSLVGKVFP
jgi:glyoxylase-like metal-dependent hydrolase (beta-lactamase superfamily II)